MSAPPQSTASTEHTQTPRTETAPRGAMTVVGLARAARVTPHVVRHYTRIGLLHPSRDEHNGYKLFNEKDLSRLMFIRRAKHLGYTLADVRGILDQARRGHSPCPEVRRIIRRRIDENRRRLQELTELQQRMEQAVSTWDTLPDGVPDGDSVCYLIESMGMTPREGE